MEADVFTRTVAAVAALAAALFFITAEVIAVEVDGTVDTVIFADVVAVVVFAGAEVWLTAADVGAPRGPPCPIAETFKKENTAMIRSADNIIGAPCRAPRTLNLPLIILPMCFGFKWYMIFQPDHVLPG